MNRTERRSLAAIPLILILAGGIAWAGAQGGARFGGHSVFALCVAICFVINWLAFIPAYRSRSERFFDLTGSLTYGTVVVAALTLSGPNPRSLLIASLIGLWAFRLGAFLFARVRRDGTDGRFDAIKHSFPRFLMTWTLQGLWVSLTAACALAAMTSAHDLPLGLFAAMGTLVWLAGFGLEVVADEQKRRFRSQPENRDRFIRHGVWAWSRHPNYLGEITLWFGIALIALPVLQGWQHLTLISPLFVYLLLTRVSGVPMLEARGKRRFGDDPAYRRYCEETPVLFPFRLRGSVEP